EAMTRLAKSRFHKINVSSVQQAFYEAKWHGRFELISKSPYLIVDGAHNPAGTLVLKQSLLKYFPGERFTFIVGVYQDKDYETMMKKMLPLARRVYTVRAAGERAIEPEELAQVVKGLCAKKKEENSEEGVVADDDRRAGIRKKKMNLDIPVKACQSTAQALEEIRRTGQGEKIVVFGSLSFVKDVYHYFDTTQYI
ncbi:MAG: cyanophycin synthetase, partial [Clostridia bacterium]|nr:cyanophycin synthetase [Clostridia bacterium]